MTEIRKYEKKDFYNVQYVCLHSEGEAPEREMCEFILHIFCDYYIENEGENCFVLSDDGKAVGYIICAENYDNFEKTYNEKYIPLVSHMNEGFKSWAATTYELHKKYRESYPAHLHIDILPSYQRFGWGGRLLNTLEEHLKRKNISGVMLTTGTDNKTACNFYKKHGFEVLEIKDTDIAFGLLLK